MLIKEKKNLVSVKILEVFKMFKKIYIPDEIEKLQKHYLIIWEKMGKILKTELPDKWKFSTKKTSFSL